MKKRTKETTVEEAKKKTKKETQERPSWVGAPRRTWSTRPSFPGNAVSSPGVRQASRGLPRMETCGSGHRPKSCGKPPPPQPGPTHCVVLPIRPEQAPRAARRPRAARSREGRLAGTVVLPAAARQHRSPAAAQKQRPQQPAAAGAGAAAAAAGLDGHEATPRG